MMGVAQTLESLSYTKKAESNIDFSFILSLQSYIHTSMPEYNEE